MPPGDAGSSNPWSWKLLNLYFIENASCAQPRYYKIMTSFRPKPTLLVSMKWLHAITHISLKTAYYKEDLNSHQGQCGTTQLHEWTSVAWFWIRATQAMKWRFCCTLTLNSGSFVFFCSFIPFTNTLAGSEPTVKRGDALHTGSFLNLARHYCSHFMKRVSRWMSVAFDTPNRE